MNRPQQAVQQIWAEGFKGPALEARFNVQGAIWPRGDKGEGDGGAEHARELLLGLLRGLGQALQSLTVATQIDGVLSLESIGQPIDNAPVPVVAPELGVSAGGFDIEHPLGDAQNRDVKGAAAQVEHQHPLDAAAIKAIGQGSRGGFVEDPLHLKSG